MSGPIIRKYGVPNWDDIFGKSPEVAPESSTPSAKAEPTKGKVDPLVTKAERPKDDAAADIEGEKSPSLDSTATVSEDLQSTAESRERTS